MPEAQPEIQLNVEVNDDFNPWLGWTTGVRHGLALRGRLCSITFAGEAEPCLPKLDFRCSKSPGSFLAEAFVTAPWQDLRWDDLREPKVAQRVSHGGYAHAKYRKELRTMTDEELHETITKARRMTLHHRMEKFRRKQPSAGSLYEWQYKIALAKTFLKQRELAAAASVEPEDSEPLSEDAPDRPTLANWMKENEDLDSAETEWYARPGWGRLRNEKLEFPREIAFERRYYEKYDKEYKTNNEQVGVGFNKGAIDLKKARKQARKTTAAEALPSKPQVPAMGSLAGAAVLAGLWGAARGRRW
ncbi:Zcchc11 [Symbiodinium sp. CCMP2592]|nr:Zcchc11 [Symbiodinium sp. CCMP2592]